MGVHTFNTITWDDTEEHLEYAKMIISFLGDRFLHFCVECV